MDVYNLLALAAANVTRMQRIQFCGVEAGQGRRNVTDVRQCCFLDAVHCMFLVGSLKLLLYLLNKDPSNVYSFGCYVL